MRVRIGLAIARSSKVQEIGRRRWKKVSGYHRQARVENAFFRYKSIIGEGLRARTPGGQVAKALLVCNVLNQMTALARPASYRIVSIIVSSNSPPEPYGMAGDPERRRVGPGPAPLLPAKSAAQAAKDTAASDTRYYGRAEAEA